MPSCPVGSSQGQVRCEDHSTFNSMTVSMTVRGALGALNDSVPVVLYPNVTYVDTKL